LGCDVDTVAEDVAPFDDNVTHIDAHPELDAAPVRGSVISPANSLEKLSDRVIIKVAP
jgi:hypothetical protein